MAESALAQASLQLAQLKAAELPVQQRERSPVRMRAQTHD
jgi:hypothetical protein